MYYANELLVDNSAQLLSIVKDDNGSLIYKAYWVLFHIFLTTRHSCISCLVPSLKRLTIRYLIQQKIRVRHWTTGSPQQAISRQNLINMRIILLHYKNHISEFSKFRCLQRFRHRPFHHTSHWTMSCFYVALIYLVRDKNNVCLCDDCAYLCSFLHSLSIKSNSYNPGIKYFLLLGVLVPQQIILLNSSTPINFASVLLREFNFCFTLMICMTLVPIDMTLPV